MDARIETLEGQPSLVVRTSPDHIAVIPLAAVASWGELLGLDDQAALAAILAEWAPEPDGAGDNGWTGLYDALGDQMQTGTAVYQAASKPVGPLMDGTSSVLLSAMGRFGPELIVAQAEAITEDVQRTRTASLAPAAVPADVLGVLTQHQDTIDEARGTFRASLIPDQGNSVQ